MSGTMSDAGEFLGQAIALDPSLRTRVLALADLALSEAEWIMAHGDPRVKSQLIRSFMAVFARQMQAENKDEAMDQLRKNMDELRKSLMTRRPEGEGVDPEADAVKDGPGTGA